MFRLHFSLIALIFVSCQSVAQPEETPLSEAFKAHWYDQKAEITSYDLEQVRYGQIYEGEAVLIYVTEDFSKTKHVKLDYPDKSGNDKVPVLKLNSTKKFNTGIYPYSIMQSTFTPVEKPTSPMKLSYSVQEWCGHAYAELHQEKNKFKFEGRSYFEGEEKQSQTFENVILEDNIWMLIKINPLLLPTGKIEILPAVLSQRIRHKKVQAQRATATLNESPYGYTYNLTYTDLNRSLSIVFRKAFPHQIRSWESCFESGYGAGKQKQCTKATLKKSTRIDYWNKNSKGDEALRLQLLDLQN